MQTPEARSVGTSTNLAAAAGTILDRFPQLSQDGTHISVSDLRAVVRPSNKPDPLADAARFFLVSPVAQALAGDGARGLTRQGLSALAQAVAAPDFDKRLQTLPAPRASGRNPLLRLLSDPGVPNMVREQIIGRYSDDQLLQLFGRPLVSGSAQDARDITTAFLFLIRLSWLGAAEAEQIIHFKVPYRISHDPKDRGKSFWNGQFVLFADNMLSDNGTVDTAALRKHIGVFAHESGHAIYDRSGTKKRFEADMKRAAVTAGMEHIVDEAVAGVCQNRAHVAVSGYGANKDSDANLALLHDIGKNIASSDTMYAKYYHVDVEQARAQITTVGQLVSRDVLPFLQYQLRLLDDPQLDDGLPASAAPAPRMRQQRPAMPRI